MKAIEELGRTLEHRWNAANYDEDAFPELATEALKAAELPSRVGPLEPLHWLLSAPVIPRQLSLTTEFGQPPLTVFGGHRFIVDLYYWADGTTEIHQHGFSGAFQVLSGSSMHGIYRWEEERRINSRLRFGALHSTRFECLGTGDIRPIRSGRDFIHSLFHLDSPSVSVVVRTRSAPDAGVQLSYRPPSIAIDPFFEEPRIIKSVQALVMLHRIGHPSLEKSFRSFLNNTDLLGCYLALQGLLSGVAAPPTINSLFDITRDVHGKLSAPIIDSLNESARQSALIEKRASISDARHRFFLAILLSVRDRKTALSLIEDRFPGREPASTTIDLLRELTDGSQRSLGLTLDEASLSIAKHILLGLSDLEVIQALRDEYETNEVDAQTDQILAVSSALRSSPLLTTLFRT